MMVYNNKTKSSSNLKDDFVEMANQRKRYNEPCQSQQLSNDHKGQANNWNDTNNIFTQHWLLDTAHRKCTRCELLSFLKLDGMLASSIALSCGYLKNTIDAFPSCMHALARRMTLQTNMLSKTILVILILFYLPITSHSKKYWSNRCLSENHSNVSEIPWCIPPANVTDPDLIAQIAADRFKTFEVVMSKFHPETFTIHEKSIQDCCVSLI